MGYYKEKNMTYKWISTNEEPGSIWYFVKHDGENFLGWKYDFKELTFYSNAFNIGSSKNWFYSRIPAYRKNGFVEKKGWKNFTKKKQEQVRKTMILNLFGEEYR